MDVDDARARLVEESKRVGRVLKDGAVAAELAWTTIGSPVPVPQQPNLADARDTRISWSVDNPSSAEQQTQNIAEHNERLQEQRRRQAFEEALAVREPVSREERPRERGR